MWKRKALFAALVASTLGAFPLAASADKVIVVREAPPAPRHEVIPAERHGYVWAPGYWDYRHGHYTWVKGHWEREHHGMYWHPHRWVEREGKWEFERGRWDRERFAAHDKDHDGVPNSVDHDKDGDGVPNRYDNHPNNPNRR